MFCLNEFDPISFALSNCKAAYKKYLVRTLQASWLSYDDHLNVITIFSITRVLWFLKKMFTYQLLDYASDELKKKLWHLNKRSMKVIAHVMWFSPKIYGFNLVPIGVGYGIMQVTDSTWMLELVCPIYVECLFKAWHHLINSNKYSYICNIAQE